MRIGVDGYCFHRYFGEVYPGLERAPETNMTLNEVVDYAAALGAEALSIEHFMLPPDADLPELRARLERSGLELMWAWGHPDGLGSGTLPAELQALMSNVDLAERLGARVMRICAGGRRTRNPDWSSHRELLLPLLRQAGQHARSREIALAVENHMDFTSMEIVDLIETLGMDSVGICLDTGNQIRMGEDSGEAVRRMAPYALASHFKDVAPDPDGQTSFAAMPSVPIGTGLLDVPRTISDLAAVGFDGILALEIDYLHPRHDSLDDALHASIAAMRRSISSDKWK